MTNTTKIAVSCVVALLGIGGYFSFRSFTTFGPQIELSQANETTPLMQRYINQNTEQYPQFLQGDHALGKRTFNKWCTHCHAPGAMEHAGTIALRFKYQGKKPEALENRVDLHPVVTEAFVRNGVKSMPSFRRTEISDEELEALANYLARNLATP